MEGWSHLTLLGAGAVRVGLVYLCVSHPTFAPSLFVFSPRLFRVSYIELQHGKQSVLPPSQLLKGSKAAEGATNR